jgi:hypothetical protein
MVFEKLKTNVKYFPINKRFLPYCGYHQKGKVKETVYYTEPTRLSSLKRLLLKIRLRRISVKMTTIEDAINLKEPYTFEMVPTIGQVEIPKKVITIAEEVDEKTKEKRRFYKDGEKLVPVFNETKKTVIIPGEKNPRFINYYLSSSNSGKSYQIAALCRRYLEMWPNNLIAYASANPIENDKNYDDIRHKIKEVDVINLESTIDFKEPQYHNSLWIFDDCDSGFSVSMEDLDKRLTKEELEKLSVTDKEKL